MLTTAYLISMSVVDFFSCWSLVLATSISVISWVFVCLDLPAYGVYLWHSGNEVWIWTFFVELFHALYSVICYSFLFGAKF